MIHALFAVLGLIGGLMFIPPIGRWFNYSLNALLPNAIPTVEQLVTACYRGIISEEEYKEKARMFGYDEKQAGLLFKIAESLISPEALVIAKWRGIISEEEYYEGMRKRGYSEEQALKFEQVRLFYPSPADFIRFGVREVFDPGVVKKYGYDKDFPEDIIPHLEKTGMSEEQMRWYWFAHWILPSPTAGYTMLHRLNPDVLEVIGEKYKEMGLTTEEITTDLNTLRELLRVSDYPPYWRDRLLAISYSPLTRVDLRRIYVLGLIDDEELIARLMEVGYSRGDAEKLAEFYKTFKQQKERDLTKTMVLNGFIEGLMTREDCKSYLQHLGYDEYESEFLISLEEKQEEDKELKDRIEVLKHRYSEGELTANEFKAELEKLELSLTKIERELIRAEREKQRKTKLPTKDDLKRWLSKDIITKEQFREIMKQLGYAEKYIDYWIKEVT